MAVHAASHKCKKVLVDGLYFARPVISLVGESGSGKSAVLAVIAEAQGVDTRGGSPGRRYALPVPKNDLVRRLAIETATRGSKVVGRKVVDCSLCVETVYGHFQFIERRHVSGFDDWSFVRQRHTESFWQLFEPKFPRSELYLMDEQESTLPFSSYLHLIGLIQSLITAGSQVICATHSPLLVAFPQAYIIEIDDRGLCAGKWAELESVDHWRRYINSPDLHLRCIIDLKGRYG